MYIIAASAFALGAALAAVITINRKTVIEPRYIDRSGITGNQAYNFIDVWGGKVMNIRFKKWVITFSQIPAIEGLNNLNLLSGCHAGLLSAVTSKGEKVTRIEQKTFMLYYSSIIEILYRLSAPHVPALKRFFYRRDLFAHALKDTAWTLDIVENLIDYWTTIKKKIEMLSKGKTLTATIGGRYSWNSLKTDTAGNILIRPRFGKS
jgi:hypothetical protein